MIISIEAYIRTFPHQFSFVRTYDFKTPNNRTLGTKQSYQRSWEIDFPNITTKKQNITRTLQEQSRISLNTTTSVYLTLVGYCAIMVLLTRKTNF